MVDIKAGQRVVAGAVFAACFFALLCAPLMSMMPLPVGLRNLLFFAPQLILPLSTFHGDAAGKHVWEGVWFVYWLAVAIAFAWTGYRLRPWQAMLVAPLVIIAATVLLHILIVSAGLHFEMDGP